MPWKRQYWPFFILRRVYFSFSYFLSFNKTILSNDVLHEQSHNSIKVISTLQDIFLAFFFFITLIQLPSLISRSLFLQFFIFIFYFFLCFLYEFILTQDKFLSPFHISPSPFFPQNPHLWSTMLNNDSLLPLTPCLNPFYILFLCPFFSFSPIIHLQHSFSKSLPLLLLVTSSANAISSHYRPWFIK